MNQEFIEQLLENLENTCFPAQINWNLKALYLKGLDAALEKTLRDNEYVIMERGIHNDSIRCEPYFYARNSF